MSPCTAVMKLSWNCHIVMNWILFIILTTWIEWWEEHCLPPVSWLFSSCNKSMFEDRFLCWKEHPLWYRNSFHPWGKNSCPNNSGAIVIPPECLWIARMYVKAFWEVSQYSNLTLFLPLWICSIHCVSKKFSASWFLNPFSNTGFIVTQCTTPSVCRSSWSKYRTNFLTPS